MNSLNIALFKLVNASPDSPAWLITLAYTCAVDLMWLVPALFIVGWLRGNEPLKRSLLEALIATLLALAASRLIGTLWPMPRPFMIPIGESLIEHSATPAFPSNHLTILTTIGISLMLHSHSRRIGGCLLLLAIPVAWARIFMGVHFPQDMAGAVLLSVLTAILVGFNRAWLVLPVYEHVAKRFYHRLFAPLISRGWVRR
ncbi:MAG: phosphatase PAP2 family protein [Halomonas sp.]|uniref:phosphatase PAP2 family protein n=1 Tax=Halomonas sp. TaxID=1486246 RepID=UPI003F915143